MSRQQVDDYLDAAPEPHRTTLAELRAELARLLPGAEQGLAYGVPAFRVNGRAVAGFGHSPNHCTYFPMSGSITAELKDRLAGYVTARGSFRFPADQPLPADLVRDLVAARQAEVERIGR